MFEKYPDKQSLSGCEQCAAGISQIDDIRINSDIQKSHDVLEYLVFEDQSLIELTFLLKTG